MKKKLATFWCYYKWYILLGAAVLVLLLNFVWEKHSQVQPDYQVAVITGEYVSESVRGDLARQLEALWPDADGDGAVLVTVNFYQYDAQTMDSRDTASFMASAVQLAADLQTGISACYFTDVPELLLENSQTENLGPMANTCLDVPAELEGFYVFAGQDSEKAAALF